MTCMYGILIVVITVVVMPSYEVQHEPQLWSLISTPSHYFIAHLTLYDIALVPITLPST